MLIGVAGEERTKLVRHLVDRYRFVACTSVPRSMSSGRRVVVDAGPPTTFRDRMTFARRISRLGGIVVWLNPHVVDVEVSLPNVARQRTEAARVKREALFDAAVARLVTMLRGSRVLGGGG